MHTRTLLLGAGVLTLLLTTNALAAREERRQTVFDKIKLAESRTDHAMRDARRAEKRLGRQGAQIERAVEHVALQRRAARQAHDEARARQTSWDRTMRTLDRGAVTWGPGTASDVAHLLAAAEPRTHATRAQEYQLISQTHHGERKVEALVFEHTSTLVRLAQQRGQRDTGQAEREQVLKDALSAKPGHIRKDLAETESRLRDTLGTLLKNTRTLDFHRYKGTLVPPVRKRPIARFGRVAQRGAKYVRHTGYTYNVKPRTRVRATAPGLVVHVGQLEGFGQVVILDHGAGYHSVYAHLAEANVRQGQSVKRSDTLATSGETGSLEGPRLYFELRKNGVPIDPGPWFVRLK